MSTEPAFLTDQDIGFRVTDVDDDGHAMHIYNPFGGDLTLDFEQAMSLRAAIDSALSRLNQGSLP